MADRGNKLALEAFDLFTLGNIAHHADKHGPPLQLHLTNGELHRENGAIGAATGDFASDTNDFGLMRGAVMTKVFVVSTVIRLRHQHVDIAAH